MLPKMWVQENKHNQGEELMTRDDKIAETRIKEIQGRETTKEESNV